MSISRSNAVYPPPPRAGEGRDEGVAMVVSLSAEARDWLLARGGEVTLRSSPRHGCCGGHAAVPVAEASAPRSPEGYTEHNVDGVRLYVERGLDNGPYRIDLEGFLSLRRLTVEGAVGRWTNKP